MVNPCCKWLNMRFLKLLKRLLRKDSIKTQGNLTNSREKYSLEATLTGEVRPLPRLAHLLEWLTA
jgi:hypothetical protein